MLHTNYIAAVRAGGYYYVKSPFPKQMKQMRYYCKQVFKFLKF